MGNKLPSRLPQQPLDFSSYENAFLTDPDVQHFDHSLKARTDRVLHALAHGLHQSGLSFNSLKEAATALLDMDHEVAIVILAYKEDVWNNRDLFQLVEEFFDNSLAALEFCTAAERSIKSARDNQLILQMALNLLPSDGDPSQPEIERMLSELNLFLQAGNPFEGDFVLKFGAVQERQTAMLQKLMQKKRKLDRKLRGATVWAKVSSIMFAAAVAAVLICTVVAAALAAPPIAAALTATASLPLSSLGSYVKSLWSTYQNEITAEREVIRALHLGAVVAIQDLETIRTLVGSLETQMKSINFHIEFTNERRDAVALKLAVDEITSKKAGFLKELDDLEMHVDGVGKSIRQTRAIVLHRIARRTDPRFLCCSFSIPIFGAKGGGNFETA